ncbi:ABC transporter ATP-binding protein [Brevibacillus sp. TJ4]|uniref:ABC transporter ATP-binding protein n=1 Tax=Brevibacillus sp. TJ4 TaxID=3234853 RepID=UPI0037CEE191
MNQRPFTPMGVGKLLDQSFSLYRSHFGIFVLLALLWMGPVLLLQDLTLNDVTRMPLLYQDTESEDAWEALAEKLIASDEVLTDSIVMIFVYLLLVVPIMSLVSYPQLLSATFFVAKGAIEGESVRFGQAVKQSLRRFWPLVGSTVLYMLIAIGIVLAYMALCGLIAFLFIWSNSGADPFAYATESESVWLVLTIIGLYLLFLVGMVVVPGYFLLRLGFYLPFVALGESAPGFGKSWEVTKGNFWRLFGMYMVVMILYSMFFGGLQVVITAGMGVSILSTLLLLIANCLLMPWGMIVYTLAYLDLRVRKEGTDLEMMLAEPAAELAAAVPTTSPGERHE